MTTGKVTIQKVLMNAVIFPDTGKAQEYKHHMKGLENPKWSNTMSNEIGRLLQGIRYKEGKYTLLFIQRHNIPQ